MDVLHVEVVGCYGVGDRVLCEGLRLFDGVRRHEFWVELHGIVAELGDSDGLETLRALRQIRVTLHPSEASRWGWLVTCIRCPSPLRIRSRSSC